MYAAAAVASGGLVLGTTPCPAAAASLFDDAVDSAAVQLGHRHT
jgi:hypothetical protein